MSYAFLFCFSRAVRRADYPISSVGIKNVASFIGVVDNIFLYYEANDNTRCVYPHEINLSPALIPRVIALCMLNIQAAVNETIQNAREKIWGLSTLCLLQQYLMFFLCAQTRIRENIYYLTCVFQSNVFSILFR